MLAHCILLSKNHSVPTELRELEKKNYRFSASSGPLWSLSAILSAKLGFEGKKLKKNEWMKAFTLAAELEFGELFVEKSGGRGSGKTYLRKNVVSAESPGDSKHLARLNLTASAVNTAKELPEKFGKAQETRRSTAKKAKREESELPPRQPLGDVTNTMIGSKRRLSLTHASSPSADSMAVQHSALSGDVDLLEDIDDEFVTQRRSRRGSRASVGDHEDEGMGNDSEDGSDFFNLSQESMQY